MGMEIEWRRDKVPDRSTPVAPLKMLITIPPGAPDWPTGRHAPPIRRQTRWAPPFSPGRDERSFRRDVGHAKDTAVSCACRREQPCSGGKVRWGGGGPGAHPWPEGGLSWFGCIFLDAGEPPWGPGLENQKKNQGQTQDGWAVRHSKK